MKKSDKKRHIKLIDADELYGILAMRKYEYVTAYSTYSAMPDTLRIRCDEIQNCLNLITYAEEIKPVATQNNGNWIKYRFGDPPLITYQCSNCKLWSHESHNYCYHCGAKMEEE